MNRLAGAAIVALALAAAACVSAQAKSEPGGPALDPPSPPPHTVIPIEIVEQPAEPAEPAAPPSPVPVIVRPSARPAAPKPDRPAEKPVEKPDPAAVPAQPAAPAPAPLQTTANVTEVEKSIRARMAQARRDLERTEYRGLNTERRAQWDTANRFIQQADDALKVKNLVFAEQLADNAATLAAALAK
jgi:outer membrane biosynthesis protein TonB